MARNDTRRFRIQSADRAPLRAGATSWRALANLTVASALMVAVVISALALIEAALPSSASKLARHARIPRDLRAGTPARQRTSRSYQIQRSLNLRCS